LFHKLMPVLLLHPPLNLQGQVRIIIAVKVFVVKVFILVELLDWIIVGFDPVMFFVLREFCQS
jgi:hypothetical protein